MRSQTVTPGQSAGRAISPGVFWGAQALLLVAALLVGIAIISEATVGRALNGLGAVAWIVAAVLLSWGLRAEARAGLTAPVAATVAVVLAALVRPDSLIAAIIGFGVAGALVGLVAKERAVSWAMLVPAIYLPAHVLIAIVRSFAAGSPRIRAEPPPTAAIVPVAMVLAAALAGWAVSWLQSRER